jgi:putative methionine-R-sulfoxide reductase with GAF domain
MANPSAPKPAPASVPPAKSERPYRAIADKVSAALASQPDADRQARMKVVVDALWDGLSQTGVSWAGFYYQEAGDPEQLWLGPRRDKPACSPIGLHGACGKAFLSGEPLVVRDVADLGANYIACDPRDKSEVVVPVFESDGSGGRRAWGVLDIDSHDVGSFSERDAEELERVLKTAGLTV